MSLTDLNLPSPRVTLIGSLVAVVCAWLVLDFAITDPETILFAVIALGSDILVRNLTSGFFTDRYWPVVVVVKLFFCALFFLIPALGLRWLGSKRLSANGVSLTIFSWLLFYLGSLTFLFHLRLLFRML